MRRFHAAWRGLGRDGQFRQVKLPRVGPPHDVRMPRMEAPLVVFPDMRAPDVDSPPEMKSISSLVYPDIEIKVIEYPSTKNCQ